MKNNETDTTTVPVKPTTLRELNRIKYTQELKTLDNAIQFLIDKYELKEATKK